MESPSPTRDRGAAAGTDRSTTELGVAGLEPAEASGRSLAIAGNVGDVRVGVADGVDVAAADGAGELGDVVGNDGGDSLATRAEVAAPQPASAIAAATRRLATGRFTDGRRARLDDSADDTEGGMT